MRKEPNLVLVIFATFGAVVLVYYIGRFICQSIDKHNAKKIRHSDKVPKWFYK